MKLAALAPALLAAAVLPGVASAHTGSTLPVATNFSAHVTRAVPGVQAKVVDGDQTLWLRAPVSSIVRVPGTLGEQLFRFDARGVWLNLRSPTAQSDRIDRFDLRPSPSPSAPPLWHRVTSAHAYAWHEHRLHVLEPLAHAAGVVGPWEIPVVVDGRRRRLAGVLDYRPPGRTWIWIGATAAASLLAAGAAVRRRTALGAVALAVVPLSAALRIGRELYGRPNVPLVGDVEIGITAAVGVALLAGLAARDQGTRVLTAFVVGFVGLYEGVTMLPLLTHAIALNALPSSVARVIEVLVFAGAVGALSGSIFGSAWREEIAPMGRDVGPGLEHELVAVPERD